MYRLISTRITSTFFFSLLNQVLAEKVATAPITRPLTTISLSFFLNMRLTQTSHRTVLRNLTTIRSVNCFSFRFRRFISWTWTILRAPCRIYPPTHSQGGHEISRVLFHPLRASNVFPSALVSLPPFLQRVRAATSISVASAAGFYSRRCEIDFSLAKTANWKAPRLSFNIH